MRVLITRPLEDAGETARQLKSRGHQALVAPLLTLRLLDGPEVRLDDVQAILATSANGARALAGRTSRRDIPLFAVGPQTAGEARKLGFQSVKSADGDANALALAAGSWAEPGKGALLHVAGEGNEGRLAGALPAFTVRREILYTMETLDKMPEIAASALREGRLDAALFYSPRSAAVFAGRVEGEGLPVGKLIAGCISPAAAAALAKLAFREIRIAVRPNQDSLLETLD